MSDDEPHLRRAIRLATNGRGLVEPNPMVGCVIVKDGRVIGEGLHQQYGHPHAEPNALASCSESPEGATAYVTLEPCCHTNKQTPPCVPRLIAAKISRVVIGCLDPNPDVNGNGVRQLREAGIVVDGPLLEAECKQLIAPFIAKTVFNKPYITMKWAESADGKVAGPSGNRVQISNPTSSHQVQLLRSRCDAVLVGINTVISDDPILLPRGVPRLGVKIFASDAWRMDGNSTHIIVEPGPTLAGSFFGDNTADRLWVIQSPKIIGDETAPSAAAIPDYFVQTGEVNLDGDVLREYLNMKSNAFFAAVPSADFVLAQTEPGRAGPDRGDTPRL
jgi:pyrimidine deaminase RibD-like protein